MKVVALHTDFRIYWPARLAALQQVLEQRGDTLDVIEIAGQGSPYAFSKTEQHRSINWHILFPTEKPESLRGTDIQKKLFPLLASINPDVIIAGAIAFPSGALAVAWGRKYHKKVIIFDDAKIEAVRRNPVVNCIKQAVYNGVDAMIYPAPDWVDTGVYWKFTQDQLFDGVDVVDNDFWSKPAELQETWGRYYVSVGRQIPKKNYFSIAQAFVQYCQCVGDEAYHWVLIGEGPEHNRIVQYIADSHCEDKVHFIPFKPQNDLPAVYQHAEALITCSNQEETWGLTINEAMAGGCPIIASLECGATKTLVHDGANGYSFHCDDVNRLSELMVKFHRLSEKEKESMRNASRSIIADWGLNRFVQGCCDAIDYVCSQAKRNISIKDGLIIRFWKGRYRPV